MRKTLEQRFNEIAGSKGTLRVMTNDFNHSRHPIVSRGIIDCNAIIMLNDNKFGGISHYDSWGKTSRNFDRLVNMMYDRYGASALSSKAVVVGGDEEHFERILGLLKSYDIPIIGQYCDRQKRTGGGDQKNILVIPSRQEVFLHSPSNNAYSIIYQNH